MEFVAKFTQSLIELGLENQRVLVAVSGGADSIALLRGLHVLARDFSLDLHVAHANHGVRLAESDADSLWVQSTCRDLSLPCVVADFGMSPDQAGIEESARDLRFEFLIRTAQQTECAFVVLGHTANDQTETVLHHLLRGTGLAGLRGIPKTRPLADGVALVRPLLEISREEVETWLRSLGQSWREDHTNRDDAMTRNRIRNQLIPQLEEQFNPQIARVLRSLSTQAGEWYDLIKSQVEPLVAAALVSASDTTIRIHTATLRKQLPLLVRESLVQIWTQAGWPLQRMGFAEWDSMANLIANDQNARSFPGNIDARKRGELLVLTRTI